MSSRNNILNALRFGLGESAFDWAGDLTSSQLRRRPKGKKTPPEIPPDADIFSDIPTENLVETFVERLTELSGDVFIVDGQDQVSEQLSKLVDGYKVCTVESLKPILGDIPATTFDGSLPNSELAGFDVIITDATALVARTGSVLLPSSSAGRRVSTLAPFHIVIASKDKLVPSLEQALTPENMGASTVIISGPARTADIEKILVLGAHGPKRLAVIVY